MLAIKWVIVGACHIHRPMSGGALRGNLPDRVRPVLRLRLGGGYREAIRDQKTGTIMSLDPRLGALPLGWRLGEHEQQEYLNPFVNHETGEETESDLTLTSTALKERGVQCEHSSTYESRQ